MAAFERSFSTGSMDILGMEPRPGWWQDILDFRFTDVSQSNQRLFLAIRKGYLNAYVEGQSVLKIKFDNPRNPRALRARIHHKYLKNDAIDQIYKIFDGSHVDGTPYNGTKSLSSWVERAQCYARPKNADAIESEKQGVAVIAGRNANVIDVEMALPGLVADRIDMVALERDDATIRIVFYEAKLFSNGTLRAKNFQPKVLEQLGRYVKWLGSPGRAEEVVQAYRQACKLLIQLRTMQSVAVHDLVVDASKDGSNLQIDPKPRLIVFGYKTAQLTNAWKRHECAIKKAGFPLIIEPRPQDVTLQEIAAEPDRLIAPDGHPEARIPRPGYMDEATILAYDFEGPEAVAEMEAAARHIS
jgi:hypothetical protein